MRICTKIFLGMVALTAGVGVNAIGIQAEPLKAATQQTALYYPCEVEGCMQNEEHTHNWCEVEGCTRNEEHTHNWCEVEGCMQNEEHTHFSENRGHHTSGHGGRKHH